MGSEGPSALTIHVTGFKKFHGVAENPTETIVGNLKEYMDKKGTPESLVLGSCKILESAGQGALGPLFKTLQSALEKETSSSPRILCTLESTVVHLDLLSNARQSMKPLSLPRSTRMETSGVFLCSCEKSLIPALRLSPRQTKRDTKKLVPIIPADGPITSIRKTTLPVEEIAKSLAQMGYYVSASDDAGHFAFNYVYYQSLYFAEQNNIKSLFVHVPLFLTIDEETQMRFVASFLEILATY